MQSRCFPFLASNFLVGGHSKSTFIEEERETGGKGWGPSMRVRLLFKKNAEIFKMKFYSYSPFFPIDCNGTMKH